MKIKLLLVALIVGSFAGQTAQAQTPNWDMMLTNPDQLGMPGDTLIYNADLTNGTGADLSLNGIALDFGTDPASSFYDVDFTNDFLNLGFVIPASGYNGSLFFVTWHPDATAGLMGTGLVRLDADIPATPSSISLPFSAGIPVINDVPEPGKIALLMGLAVPGSVFLLRRRQRYHG